MICEFYAVLCRFYAPSLLVHDGANKTTITLGVKILLFPFYLRYHLALPGSSKSTYRKIL
jgi:hypothetical protein